MNQNTPTQRKTNKMQCSAKMNVFKNIMIKLKTCVNICTINLKIYFDYFVYTGVSEE